MAESFFVFLSDVITKLQALFSPTRSKSKSDLFSGSTNITEALRLPYFDLILTQIKVQETWKQPSYDNLPLVW